MSERKERQGYLFAVRGGGGGVEAGAVPCWRSCKSNLRREADGIIITERERTVSEAVPWLSAEGE